MKDEKEPPKRKFNDRSISLHPLTFDEALGKLLSTKPIKIEKKKKKKNEKNKTRND